nr:MAG TPA: tail tape measure protein [Caudoviricetes sp.]
MASKSDGQIVIDSEIKTDGMEKDIQEVRKSVDKIVDQLENLEKSFKEAFSASSTNGAVSAQNKLQSEISETNNEIKSLSEEDKKLNSQMEKDTGSGKYDNLQKEISETESDLESLASKSKSTDAKIDSGDAGAGKYKKLQSEIDQTEDKMSGLKGAADSAAASVEDSVDNMTDAVGDLNDQLDSINKGTKFGNLMQASENLSGAGDKLIEFGKSTIQMSSDIQSATSRVNGYFGLTGQAAEEMGTVLENVFKTGVTDNMDEVAESTIIVKNNLKDLDNTSLEKITYQAITMEQVFGVDMNETMRGAKALVEGFGVSAEDAMNLLAKGAQNGLNYTDELGDNISEYGPRFAQMGFSASEYFSILQAGADNGAYSLDRVNDFLNEFQTSLADGRIEENLNKFSKSTQELYKSWKQTGEGGKELFNGIISELAKMPDGFEKANLASTLWSSLGEDNALSMIESLGNVKNVYEDVGNAAENMTDSTTTPMQELQAAVNEAKVALAPLGTTLLELATKALPPIVNGISKLVGFFTKLPGPVQTAVVILGVVLTAFLVLAPAISSVATIVLTMLIPSMLGAGTAAGTASIGFGALITALLPIIAVIALIAAAIIGIIALVKNWGKITDWFKGVFSKAMDGIKNVLTTLRDFFMNIFDNIKNIFMNAWNAILQNPVVQTIVTTIVNLFNILRDTLSTIWNGIKQIASGVWNLIKNVIMTPVLLIIDLVTGNFDQLKSDMSKIWTNIKNAASTIWNGIKTAIGGAVNGIVKFATTAFNGIKNVASKITTTIKNTITKLPQIVVNGFNKMISFITSLPSKAVKWGKDIIQGIINGIKSMLGKLGDMASNVAGKIRSFLHFSVPDEGPLADADEYGPDFMKLLASGMEQNIGRIRKAAQKVASSMQIPDYTVRMPYLAQGVIAPATSSVTNYNRTQNITNNNSGDMTQLMSLMRQLINMQKSGGNYEFTAKINRKVLFDEMMEEAKMRRIQTGKNPYETMA